MNQANAELNRGQMGACEIAVAIRERKVSCREVVSDHLARIEAVNGKLNAVTVTLNEQALAAADLIDNRIDAGQPVGPLAGVPITVKENIDLVGSATTFGLAPLKDAQPAVDAPHIAQLKRAGAIPIGRTNLSDFGLRPHTANRFRGETVNPWDGSTTPGGSSGGDAVAVATGMSALGLGNDYGGSLRGPAQFCGVCALKPSLGRVPDHMSLMPAEPAISTQLFLSQGVLARRVEDLRVALEHMSGFDARDPRWVPAPLFGSPTQTPTRVAVTFDPGGRGVGPQVAEAIKQAADRLCLAGYVVDEVEPPAVIDAWENWIELTGSEIKSLVLPGVKEIATPEALTFLNYWTELCSEGSLYSYMAALAHRNALARQWLQFQEKYPLILGPALTHTDFKPNFDIQSLEETRRFILASRLVMVANTLGLPAVVLPVTRTGGIPGSVQVIGSRFREDLVLDAAQRIEQPLLAPQAVEKTACGANGRATKIKIRFSSA